MLRLPTYRLLAIFIRATLGLAPAYLLVTWFLIVGLSFALSLASRGIRKREPG